MMFNSRSTLVAALLVMGACGQMDVSFDVSEPSTFNDFFATGRTAFSRVHSNIGGGYRTGSSKSLFLFRADFPDYISDLLMCNMDKPSRSQNDELCFVCVFDSI